MLYPEIDPIIAQLGPLTLRWYGLMYVLGFGACYLLGAWRTEHKVVGWTKEQVSDMVFFGVAGAVLGGRIGYVFFYGFDRFLDDPTWLVRIWEGGMSFHGGLLGVVTAMWLFGRKTERSFWTVTDFLAPLVPPGLGFGRLGNFINAELPGRVTDAAVGMRFPCESVKGLNRTCYSEYEEAARHVSSLYQAGTEGLLLFCLLWWYARKPRAVGAVSGMFLVGYGAMRFSTEFFRQPDADLGFILFNWLSMGQLLSLPMILIGIYLINRRTTATS